MGRIFHEFKVCDVTMSRLFHMYRHFLFIKNLDKFSQLKQGHVVQRNYDFYT